MLTVKNVTILIPAYNEEDVIKPLYERLAVLASKLVRDTILGRCVLVA
jgi:hypothetical protein